MIGRYRIKAYWGPRRENAAVLAPRMLRMLQGLADIDPFLSGWQWVGRKNLVPTNELDVPTVERLLKSHMSRDDGDGKPIPELGHYFSIHTRWGHQSQLQLTGRVGVHAPSGGYDNDIDLDTNSRFPPDEAVIKYGMYKAALTFLATLWRANWVVALPRDLFQLLPRDEKRMTVRLYGGWITFLSSAWATKITPPKSAIVERAPDGGLLMIATEETFRIDNPRHVAVAREIDAALAPLNALPWPPNDAADGRAVADR